MNKYIAWNDITKDKIEWEELVDLDKTHDLSLVGLILNEDPYIKLFQSTGKTDIHGREIYYDFHVVKFKKEINEETHEFVGVITFNEDELRAEIDIYDKDPRWVCLWYDCLTMSDFEIIGNVKENPELIGRLEE